MSHTGKLKLEGAEQDGKPSKRKPETHGKPIREEREERGEGSKRQKTRITRAEEKKFKKIIAKQAKSQYHNPDPLFRLIGEANETEVVLNQTKLKALVDLGSQNLTLKETLAKLMGLKIKSLKNILEIEGTGGIQVKYKGYVEADLSIPQVKGFEETCLFVVIGDSEYGKRVPIQIGTLHIDMVLEKATKEELSLLGRTWERGTLLRKSVKRDQQFDLDQVDRVVKTVEMITIQPREMKKVSGMAQFRGASQRINLVTEPLQEDQEVGGSVWVTIPAYAECKSGSSRVGVAIRNISKAGVVIAKGQQIARVTAANQVPNMLAPKYVERDVGPEQKGVVRQERVEKLWEQLVFSGTQCWTPSQKSKIQETLEDFHDVFALSPMELGCTSLVKHSIKIVDLKPFKERYRRIPPHQFEEVRKHLKEMEDIGAIRRSNSP